MVSIVVAVLVDRVLQKVLAVMIKVGFDPKEYEDLHEKHFLDSESSSTSSEDDTPKPTRPSIVTRHRSGHITRVSSILFCFD